MREGISTPPEQEIISQDIETKVERDACFEGNESELLFTRLEHPAIRKQLIDRYIAAYEHRLAHGPPTVQELDDNGNFVEVSFKLPTREEIEKMIDVRLREAAAFTLVEFDTDRMPCLSRFLGDAEVENPPKDVVRMGMKWKKDWDNQKPTTKQLSIIEAHEKGHQIRKFGPRAVRQYFQEQFSAAFDVTKMEYTREQYEQDKKRLEVDLSYEEAVLETQEYMGDANEIAERMSQLKNYFGMRGNEEFTAEHLRYAREHYIKDTGMDNSMTLFFQGITRENEEGFLRLINSAGI